MITIGAIYAYWDGYVDDNNYINYVFRPLWAIQVILDRFGQFGPFLATFNHFVPQIWSPSIALKILLATFSGSPLYQGIY